MRELLRPGARVLLASRPNPARVTAHSLIMAFTGEELVSVDSGVPNRLLDIAFRQQWLPEFAGWEYVRREVSLGQSRLDFLLAQTDWRCWVEAKSVTLVEQGRALFPDAPTQRGTRHLHELARAHAQGERAAVVFIVQRGDAEVFSPNRATDPEFAAALGEVMHQGIEVFAYTCRVNPQRIEIDRRIRIRL